MSNSFDWQFFPDWQKAQEHGKAVSIGQPINELKEGNSNPEERKLCYCCLNYIQKQQIPLCENTQRLDFLGNGFPLYFTTLKYAIGLLVILMGTYSVVAIHLAVQTNYQLCVENRGSGFRQDQNALIPNVECTSFLIYVARIQRDVSATEGMLRIVAYAMQMIALMFIRIRIRYHDFELRNRNRSISDYSLMVRKMSKNEGLGKNLRSFFRQSFSRPIEVESLTYIPQLSILGQYNENMEEATKNKRKMLKKLKKRQEKDQKHGNSRENQYNQTNFKGVGEYIDPHQRNSSKLIELQGDLGKLEAQQNELTRNLHNEFLKFDQQMKNDTILCNMVIVTFTDQTSRRIVLDEIGGYDRTQLSNYFGSGSSDMKFERAPQPQQIIWENLFITRKARIWRAVLTFVLTVGVLGAITVVYYFVLRAKTTNLNAYFSQVATGTANTFTQSLVSKALAIVYIFLILMVNFNKIIIAQLAKALATFQKPHTVAQRQLTVCIIFTICTFWTIGIIILFAETIARNYSGNYGLLEQLTILIILAAGLTPIVWLIYPSWILRKIVRKYYYGKSLITQKKANQIMEQPIYLVGKRYGQILHLVWVAFFIVTFIPFGSLIVFGSLVVSYFVDKYNLLRRSSIRGKLSTTMYGPILKLLEFTLVLRPIGQLVFDTQVRGQFLASSVVFIILGVIYMLIPWGIILDYLYNEDDLRPDIPLNDIKHNLPTYHTYHPIYRELYLKDHLARRNLMSNYNDWKNQRGYSKPINQIPLNLANGTGPSHVSSQKIGSQGRLMMTPAQSHYRNNGHNQVNAI